MRGLRVAGEATVVLFLCMIVLSSCQKGNGKKSESSEPEKAIDDTTPPVASTASSGRVGPSSTDLVTFSPEAGSASAGSEITFPPGSLAVETNVRVEDGTKLATAAVLSAMGVKDDNNVQKASESVAILADDTSVEAATPFTVALKLNTSSASLADSDLSNLIVIYQANVNGTPVFGVIPRSELTVENGKISFGTVYFGVYQAALVELPTSMPTQQVPSGPIATKRESIAAPLQVTQFTPVAFTPGTKVEVKGVNLRPSIEVILAGIPAVGVVVSSATTMSFVVPADVKAGNIDVLFRQDGVSSTVSGFVASGTENAPSISDDPTKRYVTDIDRASWDLAAAWGDHRQAGYLKELGNPRLGSLLLISAGGFDTSGYQTALTLLAPKDMTQSRSYVLPLPPASGGLFLTSDTNGTMSWASAGSNVSNGVAFDGSASRSIAMDRAGAPNGTAGHDLAIEAGGTKTGNANQSGGTLVLSSGVATGSGSSRIDFLTASSQSSGTSDNAPSAKMTILGNGFVGIGTATPQVALDVQGTTGIRATQICDETGANCKDISSGWGVGGDMSKSENLSGLADYSVARSNLGLFSMAQQAAGSVAITGGTIQNVGIGTATITGSSINSGTLSSSSVGAGTYFGVAGDSSIKFTGATGGYTALQGHNGTASNAVLRLPVGGGSVGQVLTTSGGSTANLSWTTPASGTVTSVATGAGLAGGTITSSGTIDLRLNGSGGLDKNLGAGTNELGIAALGVTDAMLAGSISQGKISNLAADLAAKGNVFNGNQPNGALTVGTNDATALTMETNGAPRITIDPTGKVGIGSASPVTPLDVVGDIAFNGGLIFSGTSAGPVLSATGVASGANGSLSVGTGRVAQGSQNVAVGSNSQKQLTGGTSNTSLGAYALKTSSGTGSYNTAVGDSSMINLTSGMYNTSIGHSTFSNISNGTDNIAIGAGAGGILTSGSGNIFIGSSNSGSTPTVPPLATTSNFLNIGNTLFGTSVNTGTVASPAGQIGIGTTTPASKLDVNGDLNLAGMAPPSQSAASNAKIVFNNTENKLQVSANGAGFEEVLTGYRAWKPSDQQVSSQTSLANDTDLFFPIGANEVWQFKFVLRHTSTSSGPGLKLAVAGPAGAPVVWGMIYRFDDAGTGTQGFKASSAILTSLGVAASFSNTAAPVSIPYFVEGIVRNVGTAGTIQLQFAQVTSAAFATKLQAGSYMIATRIE